MVDRPLQAVWGIGVPRLLELLAEALEDRGPALLPIAADAPAPLVDSLLQTMRPATLRDAEGVRSLPDPVPAREDTALVVATSGSTGTPKAAELPAGALRHSARVSLRRIEASVPSAGRDWLCVLPTNHVSGLQVLLRALEGGVEVVRRGFDVAEVLAVGRERHPHVSLVPTQLRRLLAAGADLSVFGAILLGGAAADDGLLAAARRAGGRVITTYGMTETCGGCVYDGIPLDGARVAVDPAGRVRLGGPMVFSGYRLAPELTARCLTVREGWRWFTTSDLGELDTEGRLRVRGRADDVINTGGHKVVAGEVATVLSQHAGVGDAVVVGRSDPEWGERVVAVVVPAHADRPPSLEELRSWVRRSLPGYAAPRELDLRPVLPLLPSGKPDLAALRQ